METATTVMLELGPQGHLRIIQQPIGTLTKEIMLKSRLTMLEFGGISAQPREQAFVSLTMVACSTAGEMAS
jgi:hypothetical protein